MNGLSRERRRLGVSVGGSLALALAATVMVQTPPAFADTGIISPGPLTNITITSDLNCAVNHLSDTQPEFFGGTACGTLVAVGGSLYGPANIPAGGNAGPRTAFTPVSQSGVTGTGTAVDPFTVITVVDLASSGLRLTETDSYVVGQESYRTDVQLTNSGTTAANAIIYRAGDCFLQNSDFGFGMVGSPPGAVACSTQSPPNTGGRIEQWLPITGGSNYIEGFFSDVWSAIGNQQPFPDTCRCTDLIDNGAGLSWTVTVPAVGSTTASSLITFSPSGILPLTTTKTADSSTASASSSDGYTITISNPNVQTVTLNSINDTLPTGFSYTGGSTTGVTTSDPSVVGSQLTWNGPFTVPGSGSVSLHFAVTVASTAGVYFNNAGADAGSFSVAPTGDAAPIEVTGGVPATLTLSPDSATNPIGKQHCVRATVVDVGGAPTPLVAVLFSVGGANSASGSLATDANGQALFCYVGTTVGTDTISAFADTDGNGTADAGEPGDTATKTYVADADLSVTKTDTPDPVKRGRKLTYAVMVSNHGPSEATSAALEDTLPGRMRIISVTPSQGSCSRMGRSITCALGALASAGSATVTIDVRPMRCGSRTNVASVTAVEVDPDLTNNTAEAVTKVIRCGDDDDDGDDDDGDDDDAARTVRGLSASGAWET